jgi:hypothetical protein
MAANSDRKNIFLELGSTGLNRFGNQVYEEWFSKLQGSKGIKVYTEMKDNDPIIGAVLFAIKAFCRSVPWNMDPGGRNTSDLEAASFVDGCRGDMSHTWQAFISQCLSAMLPFGWAYHELVYKRRLGPKQPDGSKRSKFNDGKIGWRKIPIRAASSWTGWNYSQDGSLESMTQQAPPDYTARTIPLQKALLFRTDEDKDNPFGRSILRNAYRPWFLKTQIEELECIGLERDAVGLPVIWVPTAIAAPAAGDSESEKARAVFLNLITNLKHHEQEGILMPLEYDEKGNKKYDVTLLSGNQGSWTSTSEIIQRYNTQITQTCLAEFMMLGVQKAGGSYALSQDKTDYFAVAVTGILDEIAEVFTTHAIPRLLDLNNIDFENYPVLRHGEVKRVDPEKLANVIRTLASSGMPLFPSPDGSIERWVLTALGIPIPEGDLGAGTENQDDQDDNQDDQGDNQEPNQDDSQDSNSGDGQAE